MRSVGMLEEGGDGANLGPHEGVAMEDEAQTAESS